MDHFQAPSTENKNRRIRLIINADDAGYSTTRDAGIQTCIEAGSVTSVSVLVNGMSAPSALQNFGRYPRISVGLHVNLTEGQPICSADSVSSLTASPMHREFLGKLEFRKAVDDNRVNSSEIFAEVSAQVERFIALHPGRLPPTHIDGHQHVQSLPLVAEAIALVAAAFSPRPATRLPCISAAERELVALMPAARRDFYAAVDGGCKACSSIFSVAGMAAPTAFLGYTTMGYDCDVSRLRSLLVAVRHDLKCSAGCKSLAHCACSPVVEWMVHPGRHVYLPDDREDFRASVSIRDVAGCGSGPDDFSMDEARDREVAVLCSKAMQRTLHECSVTLVSYADL